MAVRFNPKFPVSTTSFSNHLCPDQYVGTIDNIATTCKFGVPAQTTLFDLPRLSNWIPGIRRNVFSGSGPYTLSVRFNNPIIVVLTESPHIDEFATNNGLGVDAPIMGKTGNRFDSQFLRAVNNSTKISKGNLYDVVIMNAVQYQSSLGLPLNNTVNTQIRDFEFGQIFNDISPYNGLDDLVCRIKTIQPRYVLNCTTMNLKNILVNNEILNKRLPSTITLLSANHPSTWDKNTQFI